MARALGVMGVVVCVSFLEGTWAWILATASSEVVGNEGPPYVVIGLLLAVAWFASRATTMARLSLDRRRWILAGGGLLLALVAGTVHAGLIHPLQLVFGNYEPDYRGGGVVVVLVVAYLWGRGLALGARVNRQRILNHIVISASALVLLLVFLPLTDTVRQYGMTAVLVSFLLALASLLTEQLAGVESRRLTRLQWASLLSGAALLLIVGGSIFAGVFGQALMLIGQGLGHVGRFASPVTDSVLLGAGYLAYYLTLFFSWIASVSGVDPDAVTRAMEQAQERQPRFENDPNRPAPDILVWMVAIFLTFLFGWLAISIYYRLVSRLGRDRDDFTVETHARLAGPGVRARMQSALDWLRRRDGPQTDENPRDAIRRHYRSFQTLMARADLPRGPTQTPREFEGKVGSAVPGARAPVGELTDAYTVARYAGASEPLPDPQTVGESVTRVRDALRRSDA